MVIGSFLNVLVYRLPDMAAVGMRTNASKSLAFLALPLSFCPHCTVPIRPWYNIPLLSCLWLRGRSACPRKEQIALRYSLIKLCGGLVAVVCVARFGATWQALAAMMFCWLLLVVAWLDCFTLRLPVVLLQLLRWLGLFVNISRSFAPLRDAVLGAVSCYLALQLFSHAVQAATGGRMLGLGEGDPQLLAVLGAWLGWSLLPELVVIGSALAAAYGLALWLLRGRRRRDVFSSFASFLAFAALLLLICGEFLFALPALA